VVGCGKRLAHRPINLPVQRHPSRLYVCASRRWKNFDSERLTRMRKAKAGGKE